MSPVRQPASVDPVDIDFGVLDGWMREQGLPGDDFADVEQLGGGTQNVLIRFRRGGRTYVLRRGPRHLRRRSNDQMRREARVLGALDGTGVRAPRPIAACLDETVMHGAVFYLMEPVEGFNASVELPEPYATDPTWRHAMGVDAAVALAELGAVDHLAIGLGDVGYPDGFLERQVGRWLKELDSYSQLDGYPGPEIPGVQRVADWLAANVPSAWQPGIMHGDYHLANLMYAYDAPRVAAIVDWEMCTIGDPLLDLGWVLATWPEEDGDPDDGDRPGLVALAGGLARPPELVAAYADRTDRDLAHLTWYAVMACYKLGIVLEGSHARAFAGLATKEIGDRLHARTLSLFRRAHTFIDSGTWEAVR
ncbi:MAG: phosphotransferase [Streptosporangiales bacterium]|nr:phosphotransferase [Streptosporangiales bacterium]